MPEKLKWDQDTERLYETGVKQGVLYPQDSSGAYPKGYAWNGLTSIAENPSGADATALWANDSKYLTLRAAEEFGGTIEAYMYPDAWEECDGSASITTGVTIGQQARKPFGLSYITTVGNDTESTDHGFKIHIVYNATASPSSRQYSTINDSPEAITFSYEFQTTPIDMPDNLRRASYVVIDSTKIPSEKKGNLTKLLDVLHGSSTAEARLPLPAEIKSIIEGSPVG